MISVLRFVRTELSVVSLIVLFRVCELCSDVPSLIPDTGHFCLLSLSPSSFVWLEFLSIVLLFPKNQNLVLFFLIVSLSSISLFCFYPHFLPSHFGFNLCFSWCLKVKLRLYS